MSRREPDRVPRHAGLTPELEERFRQEFGDANLRDYWQIDDDFVALRPAEKPADFTPYHPEGIPEGASVSDYGLVGIAGDFHHFTRRQYPLDHETTLADLEAYPWPDFSEPCRHQHLEADVAALHAREKYVTGWCGALWEAAWKMTSMPKLMTWFYEAPDQAAYLLDRLTEDNVWQARRMAEAGVDCVCAGDDVGMQDRLMMSPAMWREWIKPRWAQVFRAAREVNPDIQIWLHSDGWIEPILPDLIEIGLDILNPVQPECMNPAKLKWARRRSSPSIPPTRSRLRSSTSSRPSARAGACCSRRRMCSSPTSPGRTSWPSSRPAMSMAGTAPTRA